MDDIYGNEFEALVRRTPPGCLGGFRTLPVVSLDHSNPAICPVWHSASPFKSFWRLQCHCGNQYGSVLGYELRDYAPHYRGSDLVTPLGFKCAACSSVTEILDTAVHGYHAEVGKLEGCKGSSTIRGSGERKAFHCERCQHDLFDFVAGFAYWHFDIAEDEPELPAQNFFHEFVLLCRCVRCGALSEPVDLGKL